MSTKLTAHATLLLAGVRHCLPGRRSDNVITLSYCSHVREVILPHVMLSGPSFQVGYHFYLILYVGSLPFCFQMCNFCLFVCDMPYHLLLRM